MTLERIIENLANIARPGSIIILSAGITAAIFIKGASFGIAGIAGTLAGGLVGARSFENHTEIKAKAALATPTVDTTTVKVTPTTLEKTTETKSGPNPDQSKSPTVGSGSGQRMG